MSIIYPNDTENVANLYFSNFSIMWLQTLFFCLPAELPI